MTLCSHNTASVTKDATTIVPITAHGLHINLMVYTLMHFYFSLFYFIFSLFYYLFTYLFFG